MSSLFGARPFDAQASAPPRGERLTPEQGPVPHRRDRAVIGAFLIAFALLCGKMTLLAAAGEADRAGDEGQISPLAGAVLSALPPRAEITDRNGHMLATTMPTWEIAARPAHMSPAIRREAAEGLSRLFPDEWDVARLERRLNSGRGFVYIVRRASPAQWQAAHDLGLPGLEASQRIDRVYPARRTAAHVIGGVNLDQKGVAGVERALEARLTDPMMTADPLALSVDMRVQAGLRDAMADAVSRHAAIGAAGVVMDARTGEILAMGSYPDFDPNQRPPAKRGLRAEANPTFDRASQGVYEMGSIFKIITVAAALETGETSLTDKVDARRPITLRGFTIDDYKGKYTMMTVEEAFKFSSNIGMARLAQRIGHQPLDRMMRALGLFDQLEIEMPDGARARPLPPAKWGPLETMTASYGHGVAVSPVHLAAAIATLTNGGCKVRPTLLRRQGAAEICRQVVSPETSRIARGLLRRVVEETSGRNARVYGYEMGGKTGTALKPDPKGGYDENKRIASFVTIFPASEPRYVALLSLDEPKMLERRYLRPTAGWTAAPAMKHLVTRIAPALGLEPRYGAEKSSEEILAPKAETEAKAPRIAAPS